MDNSNISLHEKMKHVKSKIKVWIKVKKTNEKTRKSHTMDQINKIGTNGQAVDEEINERLNLVHEFDNIQKVEELDVIQQSRIKWDAEGDENSRYFHCLLKQHRNDHMIKGISINGKFEVQNACRQAPQFTLDYVLSLEEANDMEKEITEMEVKKAIWDCGSYKEPSSDGFNFAFIKRYWEILKDELVKTVIDAFALKKMPKRSRVRVLHHFNS
ncbi:uncharacterized protein [Rutidosis leptorrhynchoides]|uniref:uncharacterized protein n=1 Tax=Rutidosis leptorrhynchoides TaxID=125765 RepID=UPI003A98FA28